MENLRPISLLTILAFFTACSTTTSSDVVYNLKEAPPNARVRARLDPSLLELKENSTEQRFPLGLRKHSYDIGKALKYFFSHDPFSPFSISYVGSTLQWHRIESGSLPNDGFDAEYELTVLVQSDRGFRQAVMVKGSGRSSLSSVSACQAAIENAVTILYKETAPLTGLRLTSQ